MLGYSSAKPRLCVFTFSSLAWVQKRKHSVANSVDVRVCGRSLLFTRPARVAPMARVRWPLGLSGRSISPYKPIFIPA